jgi:hypothetical protein
MGTKITDAVVLDAGEPSLVLSDIIHTMSPPPSPRNDMGHQRAETTSPEPLTEVEISQMRRRVTEMESSSGKWRTDEREKELIDMVSTSNIAAYEEYPHRASGPKTNRIDAP